MYSVTFLAYFYLRNNIIYLTYYIINKEINNFIVNVLKTAKNVS